MNALNGRRAEIGSVHPAKSFGNSICCAARHLRWVDEGAGAAAIADALEREPLVEVLGVLDADEKPVGVLSRDRLFGLMGKPFGREVLGRTAASELCEAPRTRSANSDIFSAAAALLPYEAGVAYEVLVDDSGRFRGIVSSRDLAAYMSRITQDDILLAAKLQERLLEGNEPAGGADWSFEAWSRPALGIGGDFYFTRALPDGRCFFALCDVSGKGVAAALVVAMAWGMLRTWDFSGGLVGLIAQLNLALVSSFHLEKYLTGLFAIFDPASSCLEAADMGHSHAFLVKSEGVRRVKAKKGNLPVGIDHEIEPSCYRFRLRAGETFFVHTDGLTEQEDPNGEEFSELKALDALSYALGMGLPPIPALTRAFDSHRGSMPQQDDASFMLLSLRKPSRPEAGGPGGPVSG